MSDETGSRTDNDEQQIVTIFDVPPENEHHELKHFILGRPQDTLEECLDWFDEILEVVLSYNLKIMIKPKYAIKNYASAYQLYFQKLIEDNGDSIKLINPYCLPEDIIKKSRICISKPFTSVHYVANSLKIPSLYYLPEKFNSVSVDHDLDFSTNICFGKDKLKLIINQIKGNDEYSW